MGRNVFDAAIGQNYFHEIKGAGHNDLSNRFAADYWTVNLDFLMHSPKNR
jgi:hypothetical protein